MEVTLRNNTQGQSEHSFHSHYSDPESTVRFTATTLTPKAAKLSEEFPL